MNSPDTPAGVPPPGVIQNLQNPSSPAAIFFIEGSILLFIMLVFLGFRVYTKTCVLRKGSWDDLTCAFAAIGAIYFYAAVCVAITRGKIGIHIWDMRLEFLTSNDFLIPAYAVNAWPTLVFLLTKLTFMLLYLQIFRPNPWVRYGCYLGIGVMPIVYLGFWVAQVYLTSPEPGQSWQEDFASPRYLKSLDIATPLTIVSVIFDVYIFVLPIAGVMQLHMSFRRKLGLAVMFVSGFAAVLASILSLVYRVKSSKTDYTYTAFPVQVTAFTEMAVGVSVSCMPATATCIRKLKETYTGDSSYASSKRRIISHPTDDTIQYGKESWQKEPGPSFPQFGQHSDDSRSNLTSQDPAAALELGKWENTTRTFVDGGKHAWPNETLGADIHYSRSIRAYSEPRESEADPKAHIV